MITDSLDALLGSGLDAIMMLSPGRHPPRRGGRVGWADRDLAGGRPRGGRRRRHRDDLPARDGSALPVPVLDPELVAYFEGGQLLG
jgi:hypothetical protein